jgi:hypothetical protein
VTLAQEDRIRQLRNRCPYYGKNKLKVLYEKEYFEQISAWKIERVIRKHKLCPDKQKAEKIAIKRARALKKPKERITQLVRKVGLTSSFSLILLLSSGVVSKDTS